MGFGKIALALSGGGYRASGFHLGTLEGLDKLELLEDVKVLSTISGGTFTGAAYLLARARKHNFEQFCTSFAEALEKTNVIEMALGKLKDSRASAGNASLICAAARVYDEVLFNNAYFEKGLLNASGFEDVAFNATEFVYGLSFRFVLTSSKAVIGNNYFRIPPTAVDRIRISDIVAASSCFPGGFEPLLFPHQFRFKDEAVPSELKLPPFDKPIPLMDGGIYDNQGIDSVMLAYKRNPGGFDLLLISDTDQSGGEIYRDQGVLPNGFLKLAFAIFLLQGTFVVSLLSDVALARSIWSSWPGVSLLSQIFPLITTVATSLGIAYGWFRLRQLKKKLDPRIAHVIWNDLRKLYLPEVFVFARNRLLSVGAMVFDIFMKRIRDLMRTEAQGLQTNPPSVNHDREEDAGDSDAEQKRLRSVIETRIVKIPGQGKLRAFAPDVKWLEPSQEMLAITEIAKEVGTQLWLNSNGPHKPKKVMSALRLSGEITLCASVLQHLIRECRDPNSPPDAPEFTADHKEVYDRARDYWQTLVDRARSFAETAT